MTFLDLSYALLAFNKIYSSFKWDVYQGLTHPNEYLSPAVCWTV